MGYFYNNLIQQKLISEKLGESLEKLKPLVSIITVSFNQAVYLRDVLECIKGQTYENIEHIVIDGGSTDGSVQLLKKYEMEYNLRWVSEKDRGPTHGMNKGLTMAKGEILSILNADDYYVDSNTVRTAVEALKSDIDMVYGNCYIVTSNNKLLRKWIPPDFKLSTYLLSGISYIPANTVFFKREIIQKIGYLNESYKCAMDYDFFLRIGMAGFKIRKVPKIWAAWRIHGGNISIKKQKEQIEESTRIRNRYLSTYFKNKNIARLHFLLYKSENGLRKILQERISIFDILRISVRNIRSFIRF